MQQVLKVLQLSITKKLKHTTQTAAMASDKSGNKTPSLTDIWRVLTEIKTNLEKLMLDKESLNGNCREVKDNLQNTYRDKISRCNCVFKLHSQNPKGLMGCVRKVLKRGMKVFWEYTSTNSKHQGSKFPQANSLNVSQICDYRVCHRKGKEAQ